MNSGEEDLYLCVFRQIRRGVCAERRGKMKTGGPVRKLEVGVSKRRNIAELVGYKNSGREMARKLEFKAVQGSAPTISG